MTDAELVCEVAQPLTGDAGDYDGLLEMIGDARIVLLGEASHGTHGFYFERAAIAKRLTGEKGFTVLAIEADWPDASRVHRYVRGAGRISTAVGNRKQSSGRTIPIWSTPAPQRWPRTVSSTWANSYASILETKPCWLGSRRMKGA